MVEITLRYEGKSETLKVANSWEELSRKQLLYISEYWEAWRLLILNNESLLKAKSLLFMELIQGNNVFNRKKRIDLIAKLNNEDLYLLTQVSNFVFKSNDLIKCPIKCISKMFTKLYPPHDKLGNIKAEEFAFADGFFVQYLDNGSLDYLDLMIACLYRPLDKHNGSRVLFNKDKASKSLSVVKKLTYAEKQVILIWYQASRKWMVENNKELFSSDNQNEAKNKGWLPVILALSGDKFGTFEQTGQTDMHLIFMELKEMKERSKPKQQ
jgi:hypothetical protein